MSRRWQWDFESPSKPASPPPAPPAAAPASRGEHAGQAAHLTAIPPPPRRRAAGAPRSDRAAGGGAERIEQRAPGLRRGRTGGQEGAEGACYAPRATPKTTSARRSRRCSRSPRSCVKAAPAAATWRSRSTTDPAPTRPRVLSVLEHYHVHATFFVIGRMLRYFGSSTVREIEDGDVIGDHTETHPMLAQLSAHDQYEQLFEQIIRVESLGGTRPTLFRPPYGSFDSDHHCRELKRLHLLMVLWSVDTADYKQPGVSAIVERALCRARTRARSSSCTTAAACARETIEALPLIIRAAARAGLQPRDRAAAARRRPSARRPAGADEPRGRLTHGGRRARCVRAVRSAGARCAGGVMARCSLSWWPPWPSPPCSSPRRRTAARTRRSGASSARSASKGTPRITRRPAHGNGTAAQLGAPTGRPGTRPVPILMYHVIAPPPSGAPFPGLYVTPSEFAHRCRR